jgi:hypothetical protein
MHVVDVSLIAILFHPIPLFFHGSLECVFLAIQETSFVFQSSYLLQFFSIASWNIELKLLDLTKLC